MPKYNQKKQQFPTTASYGGSSENLYEKFLNGSSNEYLKLVDPETRNYLVQNREALQLARGNEILRERSQAVQDNRIGLPNYIPDMAGVPNAAYKYRANEVNDNNWESVRAQQLRQLQRLQQAGRNIGTKDAAHYYGGDASYEQDPNWNAILSKYPNGLP